MPTTSSTPRQFETNRFSAVLFGAGTLVRREGRGGRHNPNPDGAHPTLPAHIQLGRNNRLCQNEQKKYNLGHGPTLKLIPARVRPDGRHTGLGSPNDLMAHAAKYPCCVPSSELPPLARLSPTVRKWDQQRLVCCPTGRKPKPLGFAPNRGLLGLLFPEASNGVSVPKTVDPPPCILCSPLWRLCGRLSLGSSGCDRPPWTY